MIRDFSETARQKLYSTISEIKDEQWSDFTDSIGDLGLGFMEMVGYLNIKNYTGRVDEFHKKIMDKNNTTKEKVDQIFENVNTVSSKYLGNFNNIENMMHEYNDLLVQFSDVVEPAHGIHIVGPLEKTLSNLTDATERWKDIMNSDTNVAFDGVGTFGGNQGSAVKNYTDDDILAIVRKHKGNISEKDVKKFLEQMNHEGCGYVACCNTIFDIYIGREDEFEEHFGFPMYKDGDLNYDAIIIDFYAWMDDQNREGTTPEDRRRMWIEYCRQHGIDVDYECYIPLTPANYEEMSKRGPIIMSMSPVILRDPITGEIVVNVEGGHAMTVVGVTDDGKYIVSSWGKKYLVDPKDIESCDKPNKRLNFEQVRYND